MLIQDINFKSNRKNIKKNNIMKELKLKQEWV
jgi:hypothetical protein